MDFLMALNVTIYGLGIVFLALLVLMFSIMVLSKLFSIATGKEVFSVAPPAQGQPAPAVQMAAAATEAAPAAAATAALVPAEAAPTAAPTAEIVEQVFAPLPGKILSVAVKVGDKVKAGDELCVIEAMKMGNSIKAQKGGVVGEVMVAPGQSVAFGAPLVVIVGDGSVGQVPRPAVALAPAAAPAAAAPAAAAALAGFKMGVAGVQHQVELKAAPHGSRVVVVDGVSYKVEQDKADARRIIVNGTPHAVEVKERSVGGVFVVVDGVAQKIEISGEVYEAPAKSFEMSIAGKRYQLEVNDSTVKVDGATYHVERDKADAQRLLVNGQPHAVEVKEMDGESATVVVDGQLQRVVLSGLGAPAPAPAAVPAAPAPAPASVAPTSAAAQPGVPKAPAASETVTSPLPGKILSVAVRAGDSVSKGDELCVIEAMKMGNSIKAQRAGTIKDVLVSPGQSVGFGAPLVVME